MDLKTLQDTFLRCRTYGHSWDEWTQTGTLKKADLTLRCVRCGTGQYDDIDPSGNVERRSYEYPSDYEQARLQRPDLRVELLRRLKKARR